MASSASSPPILPPHLSTSIHSLTDMIKLVWMKLDLKNYILWRALMSPILKGHDLFKYVDPTVPIPAIHNPEYQSWHRVDQLILSCIYSTITEPVMAQVVGLNTAREVWNYLETSYFTESCARVPQLRQQLQTIQKGNLSINEFTSKIKGITNVLDFVRQPISDRDLVVNILGGLGPDYESFVSGIMARPMLPSFSELHRLLIDEEIRLNFFA